MKNPWILVALAIAGWGGCTQDSLTTDYNTTTMARPSWVSGDIPDIRAVILSPEESYREPGGASLRGACDNDYVLQLKRRSTHGTGVVILRVFTKDADDTGFSAVINALDITAISTTTWITVLLYDEDNNEICFDAGDNLIFIQPNDFDEDIEFEVRLHNVSMPASTTPDTILWDAFTNYYFTTYPLTSNNCIFTLSDFCCEYEFTADEVSTAYGGTMRFRSVWDNGGVNLAVPPEAVEPYTSNNCGPIAVIWDTMDHLNTEGEGSANFECDDTLTPWVISDNGTFHGVIFDPKGRYCFLLY